jgi:hypothetical protein
LIWGFGVENGENAESGGDEGVGDFGIYSKIKDSMAGGLCY